LSRRIGRSQNGMARGSSGPPPLDDWPLWPAGSAGGGVLEARCGRPSERCLGPAVGHPLAGQAGAAPLKPPAPLSGREPPPLMGGADPRSTGRAGVLAGGIDPPADEARARAPVPAEWPAPRDHPEAVPALEPDPFGVL